MEKHFHALTASWVLYNQTEHSQGDFILLLQLHAYV